MDTIKRLEDLVGEVLSDIDISSGEAILLTTVSGKTVKIYHEQDCCENVWIEDTYGDWHSLVGKPIIRALHIEIGSRDHFEGIHNGNDSATKTIIKLSTDEHTVISNWIGESNGYYSESVDIRDISELR